MRHRKLVISGSVAALVLIGVGVAASPSSAPTASAPSSGAAAPSAQRTPTPVRHTVTYVVTGSPADVTYGPEGSNHSGSVPMRQTRTLHNRGYYAIDAQLGAGGSVACKIKVDGKTISSGYASGAYNIASCEIVRDVLTGQWEDVNTN